MKKIVCFGEVLWDVFPTHKNIGGAPLNVALRLQSLKNKVAIISRIGDDCEGKEIIDFINDRGVQTEYIQIDDVLRTGEVQITLDSKGAASYIINFARAWDAIQITENAKEITKKSDAFIFGSLVTRNKASRDTLYLLLKLAKYKIFDINLRTPHYTIEVISDLMNAADFIKFNDDEIFEIGKALDAKTKSLEETMQFIAAVTNTKSICVTKGSAGAVLYYQNSFYYNYGYKVDVLDTVGAGDSFLASLTDNLLKGVSPQESIDYACAMGSIVASREGGNPEITKQDIEKFLTLE